MHTVFALLCFVVVIHWLIFPHPSGLLHWHCGNLTIAPVPAKQPWWIWLNTSCEFIMIDCITTTKQSTTKCAYFLGYTVNSSIAKSREHNHTTSHSSWNLTEVPVSSKQIVQSTTNSGGIQFADFQIPSGKQPSPERLYKWTKMNSAIRLITRTSS